jgi:hypothetical protein
MVKGYFHRQEASREECECLPHVGAYVAHDHPPFAFSLYFIFIRISTYPSPNLITKKKKKNNNEDIKTPLNASFKSLAFNNGLVISLCTLIDY